MATLKIRTSAGEEVERPPDPPRPEPKAEPAAKPKRGRPKSA